MPTSPKVIRLVTDLARADAVIRQFRLSRPSDPVGEFSYPKTLVEQRELADFIFDQTHDPAIARAIYTAPRGHRVIWQPVNG